MSNAWYAVVPPDDNVTQGELIFSCPILAWKDSPIPTNESLVDALRAASDTIVGDVVVMTQACDIEQEKVRNLVLCPCLPVNEFRQCWEGKMKENKQNPTDRAWRRFCEDVANGFCWNLSLLNRCDVKGITGPCRIVDFHDVFTVPIRFLESLLSERKEPRIRLLPPYREHLSQAFARYFMRVGLPIPIQKDWYLAAGD